MAKRQKLNAIKTDERGAAAIEFAIVASTFFLLMFGVIEYGLIMMTKVALESATQQVSRASGINTAVPGCTDRVCAIRALVSQKTIGLINPQNVVVTSRVVSGPTTSTPPTPDICLDGTGIPYPPTCSGSFQNNDGVNGYQKTDTVQAGTFGEAVEIRVSYAWRVLFPVFRSYFGNNGALTVSATTVVKNEPI